MEDNMIFALGMICGGIAGVAEYMLGEWMANR